MGGLPIKSVLRKIYYSRIINRFAVKAYSIFRPPPYLIDNMEFHLDIWLMIATFHSEQGRQIGKNNTFPQEYKEYIETEHTRWRYQGSRKGLIFNMTAFQHGLANAFFNLDIILLTRFSSTCSWVGSVTR